MSKTIDVEKGDTWTICESNGLSVVYQYRNERTIWMFEKASARKPGLTCRTSSEKDVPQAAALMILEAWGYATPAAKDEAPAKTEPVITKRHGPVETVMVTAAEDLAATVKRVEERVNKLATDVSDLWSAEDGFSDRLEKSDKYTADVRDLVIDSGVKFNKVVNGLIERLAKLEAATTPAKVRVVVPTFAPSRVFSVAERMMIHELNCKWIAALSAAGIDVVKEAGK